MADHTDDGRWTVTTERLLLRPGQVADLGFLEDLYSREAVTRWIGEDAPLPPHAVRTRLERWATCEGPLTGIRLAVLAQEPPRPVGVVLLKDTPASDTGEGSGDIEIGWHFHPDAWGHGYATEAAVGMLNHAARLGLERIIAVTDVGNTPSQAVCRRLGMEHRGTTEKYYGHTTELFTLDLVQWAEAQADG